jgi:cytochrome P450
MTATAPAPVYPSLEGSEDPFPFLNHLREHQPVYQIPDRPNIYLLTRYDDVKRALSEWSTFSNTEARSGLSGIWFGGGPEDATMINELDPPLHRPQRVLAQAPIAPGRLRSYVTLITELVDGLIDRFIDDGSTEFVSAFAHQLPLKLCQPWVRRARPVPCRSSRRYGPPRGFGEHDVVGGVDGRRRAG